MNGYTNGYTPVLSRAYEGFRCHRDPHHVFPKDSDVGDTGGGCPLCAATGNPAGVSPIMAYGIPLPRVIKTVGQVLHSLRTLQENALVYKDGIDLGQGNTPLLSLPRLANSLGIAGLRAKCEGANLHGSYHDRLSAAIVDRALDLRRTAVATAASVNASLSLAAFAAAAGLECKAVVRKNIEPALLAILRAYGADIQMTPDYVDQMAYLQEGAGRGWYITTTFADSPIGGNPWGVQAYAKIAYEILIGMITSLNRLQIPDVVVVPGQDDDLFYDIDRGFRMAQAFGLIEDLPRMVAAVPEQRFDTEQDWGQPFSTAADTMTATCADTMSCRSELVMQRSQGRVVTVTEAQAVDARLELAKHGAPWVALSAATALAALHVLQNEGWLSKQQEVVMVLTAHGYK